MVVSQPGRESLVSGPEPAVVPCGRLQERGLRRRGPAAPGAAFGRLP